MKIERAAVIATERRGVGNRESRNQSMLQSLQQGLRTMLLSDADTPRLAEKTIIS